MSEPSVALQLKMDADTAMLAGDHMTAMDLYGDAAEQALELGLNDLSNECAAKVVEVIQLIADIEAFELPDTLLPPEPFASGK